jgi:hypothetical protein
LCSSLLHNCSGGQVGLRTSACSLCAALAHTEGLGLRPGRASFYPRGRLASGIDKPIGVAEYQLVRALPDPLDTSLPSIEEIEAELSRELGDRSGG